MGHCGSTIMIRTAWDDSSSVFPSHAHVRTAHGWKEHEGKTPPSTIYFVLEEIISGILLLTVSSL